MMNELDLSFIKIRIASLQSLVRSKNPSAFYVARRHINRVTIVTVLNGKPRLARRKLVRACR
ncbi:uncharacterized protein FTOL_08267 [Fusarium torulosum]|uniref:Uncharacterized protein n=1 Tax=Fusarium torulosum TaxID=33205 RepID=A0AAE8MF00_9HYPO|nr:uncharacterized protein FTOL_08267 [Fusarium torulosum]